MSNFDILTLCIGIMTACIALYGLILLIFEKGKVDELKEIATEIEVVNKIVDSIDDTMRDVSYYVRDISNQKSTISELSDHFDCVSFSKYPENEEDEE